MAISFRIKGIPFRYKGAINVEDALCNFTSEAYSTITTGYLVQVLYGVAVLVIALVIGQYQRRQ